MNTNGAINAPLTKWWAYGRLFVADNTRDFTNGSRNELFKKTPIKAITGV